MCENLSFLKSFAVEVYKMDAEFAARKDTTVPKLSNLLAMDTYLNPHKQEIERRYDWILFAYDIFPDFNSKPTSSKRNLI